MDRLAVETLQAVAEHPAVRATGSSPGGGAGGLTG
jgi:hypothetical protein